MHKSAVLLMDLQRDFLDFAVGRMPVDKSCGQAALRFANDMLAKRSVANALPILIVNRFPAGARIANFFSNGATIDGSVGAELDGRLERSGSEKLVSKASSSAFSNAELEPFLRAHGVQNLYVLGVFAAGRVRSTAVEAVKLGYTVHVIADAVASNAVWKKSLALWAMARAGAVILQSVVLTNGSAVRHAALNR